MEALFTFSNLVSLFTLAILEVVLGIDNVIFVSIIMGRLHTTQQLNARRIWMVAGILVRTGLLFGLTWLISQKGKMLFSVFGKGFDVASLVMIAGGLFLLYKTVKEIHQNLEGDEEQLENSATKVAGSFSGAIFQIILVDTVFSFDSMITAVGIANELAVMITAVVIAMMIMFVFSKKISTFILTHPTIKMLALSFLVMVSIILLIEGWDSDKVESLHLKNYVYFAMAFSFGVEILNMKLFKNRKKKVVALHQPSEKKMPANISDKL